ncbi:hypothetical protein N866_06790 [Actinotalea ferrariae CF5-4]|uniref:Uncharacterized protein n=2 Tax=Actinotalea TaxID=458839 RepID=A0A021VN47_9CELL|nr:hypothetical protein N866_06790 [Actinotalea ferrariae CF5-4]
MIISGVPYAVLEVDGHEPTGLGDFDGTTQLVVEGSTGRHVLMGEGCMVDGTLRFHEKTPPDGKDVRTWAVHHDDDGAFRAETV